ncbi:hypothetical protein Fmac_004704 [Flemingia macrophylla]|uniref:Uncharacterized protein n=1 Tax=Flemingia macrophylla TaxID=520843 RepID=A0ABD1N5P5_9FABA
MFEVPLSLPHLPPPPVPLCRCPSPSLPRCCCRATASSSRPNPKPLFEPVIVLKALMKPIAFEPQCRDSNNSEEERHKEVEARVGIQNGNDSFFPDQETIKAICTTRECLRLARPAAPDYISLNGGNNHGAAEGLSDEEPKFRGWIAMFGEKVDGRRKEVFEEVEET